MSIVDLQVAAREGDLGTDPERLTATSVIGIHHGTRLSGSTTTFVNRYVVIRCRTGFGVASVSEDSLGDAGRTASSGASLSELMDHESPAVRLAALDAYLASERPWHSDSAGRRVVLPAGTPEERASTRDTAVAELIGGAPGRRIALIGVVDPLIEAIRTRGCEPLPCDLWLTETAWGDPVERDHRVVVERADAVLATGMTLANETFGAIAADCRGHGVPLALYAQTGAAVARELVGSDLVAACCEPFPFSQLSADDTLVHLYREGDL